MLIKITFSNVCYTAITILIRARVAGFELRARSTSLSPKIIYIFAKKIEPVTVEADAALSDFLGIYLLYINAFASAAVI